MAQLSSQTTSVNVRVFLRGDQLIHNLALSELPECREPLALTDSRY